MIAIVVSRADRASEHIGEQLLAVADWTEHVDDDRPDAEGGGTYYRRDGFELRSFDELHISLDDPTPAFGAEGEEPKLLAFVSRHSGETGPLLTAHFTGNFGPAEYGGTDGGLARTAPNVQKRLLDSFSSHAPAAYDVGIECTHHGPSDVSSPSLFVELGSGDPQWDDPDGARAVARAVLELYDEETGEVVDPELRGRDGRTRHVVGFGGGHYAPRFTRIVEETEWAVGHIGADWQLAEMGRPDANTDVLTHAFEASSTDYAVVEGEKPDLVATVEELGYRVVGETWVTDVGDRPIALVETLERDVTTVAEGLRFGDVVPGVPDAVESWATVDETAVRDTYVVTALPNDLLARVQGIDSEATRDAVAARAIAFDTEQAGTRAIDRAAFAEPDDYDALIDALVDILRESYDDVERHDDAVVVREEAFDPSLAAKLGVPEGPAFGKLSAGQSVEVGGRVIEPHAVRRTTEERYELP